MGKKYLLSPDEEFEKEDDETYMYLYAEDDDGTNMVEVTCIKYTTEYCETLYESELIYRTRRFDDE